MGHDLNAAYSFLTAANRRAVRENLHRLYPVDDQPVFATLLAKIEAAERKEPRP